MNSSVTAVINCYRRPKSVDAIILSLYAQSVPPNKIFIWWNDKTQINYSHYSKYAINIVSDENLGVWARFRFCLNAETQYVVVFDDDTVPGSRWLENCLNYADLGLLGTVGLRFNSSQRYMSHTRVGWPSPNNSLEQVDIVGHSWFFRREWLTHYFRELPPVNFRLFGEDIHFSYALQKFCNLPTLVPPHPIESPDMWGSLMGFELGTDHHAISMDPDAASKWDIPFKYYINNGFKLIKESTV